ncbi:MAG: hypothetical protein Q8S13_08305 [Dehalococcoidia bacterium]|nr:hypothetical protein [Dehalococcoidia bacterium]
MTICPIVSLHIPESAWEPACFPPRPGEPRHETDTCADDGRCRLSANVQINGVRFYCEAVEIAPASEDGDGCQYGRCSVGENRLDGLATEFDSSEFATVAIAGREYAIFLVPCDA